MASETFLEVLARTEPEPFLKTAKDRKRRREQRGRSVRQRIDEMEEKPALFVKFMDEHPELARAYNDEVYAEGEALEDDDGDVFKSNESPDAIYNVVVAKARALRASEPTLTIEKAVSRVLDVEPQLYGRYRNALP